MMKKWIIGVWAFYAMSSYLELLFLKWLNYQTFERIRKVDFTFPKIPIVSSLAKDFISALLVKDPSQRLSLTCVLVHPWIVYANSSVSALVKRDLRIEQTSSLCIVPEKLDLIIPHEESSASASYNTGPPKSSAIKLTIATSNVISAALASGLAVCEIQGNQGLDKEGNPKNRVELHTPAVSQEGKDGHSSTLTSNFSRGSFCTSVNQEGKDGRSSTLTSNFSSPPLLTSTNVSVTSSAQGESELSNGEGKIKLASPFSFSTYTLSLQKDACGYGLVPHSSEIDFMSAGKQSLEIDFMSAGKQSLASSSSPSVPYTSSLLPKSQSSIATSDAMSGHDEIKLTMATSNDMSGAIVSGKTICGLEKESNNSEKQVELPRSRSGSIDISIDQEGDSGPLLACTFVDEEGNSSDANSSPFSSPASTLSFMNKLTAEYSYMPHSSGTYSSPIVNGVESSSFGSNVWFPLNIPWFPWQICGLEKESNHSGKQVELPGSRSCSMGLHQLINGETVATPTLGRHQKFSADAGLVLRNGEGKGKLTSGYSLLRHSSRIESGSIVNGGGSSSYGSTIWFPLKIPWFPRQIPLRLNALLENFIAHLRAIASGKINCRYKR